MKTKLPLAATLLACGVLTFSVGDASARMFSHSFNGFYGTHSASVNRVPGSASGTRSFEGYNGQGGTRNFSRSCSGGTCTGSATTTTNSGQTWSHNSSLTSSNGTTSWNRTVNGPAGGVGTRSGSCTAGAGCSSTAKATGPGGSPTYTAQRSTVPNGQGGFQHTATWTGPNNTATRSFETGW